MLNIKLPLLRTSYGVVTVLRLPEVDKMAHGIVSDVGERKNE